MIKNKNKLAFTLVEIAVVLTVVGVLSAGTLVGIKMVKNAKVTSTVAQILNYQKAVNAFYKTYGALPGDLENASKRLPGCEAGGSYMGCDLLPSGGEEEYKECSSTWDANYPDKSGQCMDVLDYLCDSETPDSLCDTIIAGETASCTSVQTSCDGSVATEADLTAANVTAQAVCDVKEETTTTNCSGAISSNDTACTVYDYVNDAYLVADQFDVDFCEENPGEIRECPEGYVGPYSSNDYKCRSGATWVDSIVTIPTTLECVQGITPNVEYLSVGDCAADIANLNPTYPYLTSDFASNTEAVAACTGANYDAGTCLTKEGGYADLASYADATDGVYETAEICMNSNGYTDLNSDGVVNTADCIEKEEQYDTREECLTDKADSATDVEVCYAVLNDEGDGNNFFDVKIKDINPTGQIGDGVIGMASWDMQSYVGDEVFGAGAWTVSNSVDAETLLFWYELKQAGLIADVTNAAVLKSTKSPQFGETNPFVELGGGFWAAHSDGCCGAQSQANTEVVEAGRPWQLGSYSLNGNILVMTKFVKGSRESVEVKKYTFSNGVWAPSLVQGYLLNAVQTDNVVTPAVAGKLDAKLDDGMPGTGILQAYGDMSSCYKYANGEYIYDDTVGERKCGLYIKITD